MGPFTRVSDYGRLHFDPGDLDNLSSPGCYFQNFAADITLGKGCYIAPNVGIITANHDPANLHSHLPGAPVTLGDGCWVGMNSVLLPGVTLGPGTVVGAGSVVTKSFPQGHCVVAGNPARKIRELRPQAET
ncbi:MAG: acyltransferase [Actinomycetota bacterium]